MLHCLHFVLKKRPGVTCGASGKNYGERGLNPFLPNTGFIDRSTSLVPSTSAKRRLGTSRDVPCYFRAYHNSYPGFLTFSFSFSIHPPSFFPSALSSLNFTRLHASCNSHYHIPMYIAVLYRCYFLSCM